MRPRLTALVPFVLFLLPAAMAHADDSDHLISMWQVQGESNRIYVLGSIHFLREKDYPLPSAIYDAYNDAETLIMELDMDDLDPVADQALARELGLIQDGRLLSDVLGPELYAEAETLAEAAGIPLKLLENSEPWYAAINVELMLLMRIGFNPSYGIEFHLTEKARADRKEILGFETTRQQLEFLDGLSPDAQREMFIQALVEGQEIDELMDSMIEAWHMGDVGFMEEELVSGIDEVPELSETIVVNRNVAWTSQIEELMDDQDDYMVIVGTLHLVGEKGVPELLAARGHEVTQLREPAD